jgi:peptide/nickel transport system substrate-binding protein
MGVRPAMASGGERAVLRRRTLARGGGGWRALAAITAAAMLLSACAGLVDGDDDEAPDEEPDGEAPPSGAADGELTYLAEDVPAGLDWDGPSAAIPATQFGMEQLYGRLMRYALEDGDDGILRPDYTTLVGELAESWEQDDLEWTFQLREGVVSCAGNELTADDVVWTFERAKSVGGAAPIGWFLLNVGSVMDPSPLAPDATDEDRALSGEIEKIDDYSFVIRQFEPNQLFPDVLAIFGLGIVDSAEALAHATEEDPFAHEWMNNEGAAGFGPYCLASWDKESEIVFEANPNWTAEGLRTPDFQRVRMARVPSPSTRTSSLLSGAADLTTALTSRDFAQIRDEGGDQARVLGVLGNENTFVHMNFSVPPFDDVRVRQAIAFAIPYEAIIEAGYFGAAEKWNGIVPPTYPGFVEIDTYDTDLDRARELLADAGYPDGEGLEQFREAFQLYYVSEKQDQLQPIATALQTGLREVGIEIELAPIPQTQYGDRQLVLRDLPFALNDQEKPIAPDAGYAVQLFFVSSELGGLNNMVNYSNDRVDDLWLNQARTEQDPDRRAEILAEIQEILMEDVAWLPLVVWESQVALRNDITGWAYDPGNAVRLDYLRTQD